MPAFVARDAIGSAIDGESDGECLGILTSTMSRKLAARGESGLLRRAKTALVHPSR
jgi:hypothetical protein